MSNPLPLEHVSPLFPSRMGNGFRSLFVWTGILLLGAFSSFGNAQERNPIEKIERLIREDQGDAAVEVLNELVGKNSSNASAIHYRACTLFRLGRIEESLKDFDKAADLSPASRPEDWQRGIALYYGHRYKEGREQFELHRTVNRNDVENSVWHFLCVAKESNIEEARKVLIPSAGDARPPMMEVLKLFRGDIQPEDVIKAAESRPANEVAMAKFYGYLYVGLYYEALDKPILADEWLKKSIEQKVGGYMRDVAVVHLKLRSQK